MVERTLISEFPQQTLTALIPAHVVAQIVSGMMIQLLGWWLENDTGHTATDLAEFMLIALQRGITAQQVADASISETSA